MREKICRCVLGWEPPPPPSHYQVLKKKTKKKNRFKHASLTSTMCLLFFLCSSCVRVLSFGCKWIMNSVIFYFERHNTTPVVNQQRRILELIEKYHRKPLGFYGCSSVWKCISGNVDLWSYVKNEFRGLIKILKPICLSGRDSYEMNTLQYKIYLRC